MHFTNWDHPITIETPSPIPSHVNPRRGQVRVFDSDEDEFDESDDEETNDQGDLVGPSTPTLAPTTVFSEATTTSVPPPVHPAPPAPLAPSAPSSSRAKSVTSILLILSFSPGRRMSLRTLLPLLHDTFLGLLNYTMKSHIETRKVVLRTLGHEHPASISLFTSPHHPTISPSRSRQVRFAKPPVVPTSFPAIALDAHVSSPAITFEALVAALTATRSSSAPDLAF